MRWSIWLGVMAVSAVAAAAEPDFTQMAREVIDGKVVAFSAEQKMMAVRKALLGTGGDDFSVEFHGMPGPAPDNMLVYHEEHNDDENTSHPSMEAAVNEAAPKLAALLAKGHYVALPQTVWSKGAKLKVNDLTFTWKKSQLSVARGKGKPVEVKQVEPRHEYAPPKPTAVFLLPGQREMVLGVHWPKEAMKLEADDTDNPNPAGLFIIAQDELMPVTLPEGL